VYVFEEEEEMEKRSSWGGKVQEMMMMMMITRIELTPSGLLSRLTKKNHEHEERPREIGERKKKTYTV
jgi:hypothetical protein